MSRQFPDNCQCCRETIVPTPALSFSFLFFIISADGGTFRSASSMAPSSELEPIILCPGPVEIQFHHQSVEPAINKDRLIPTGLCLFFFLFQSYVSGSVPLSMLKILKEIPVTRKKVKKKTHTFISIKMYFIWSVNISLNG